MKTIIILTPFSASVGGGGGGVRGVTSTNIRLSNPEQDERDQALDYILESQLF